MTGGSQGGGISIAVAALVPDIAAAMPDVPFLSDFPRAITFVDSDPYGEIVRYLKAHRDHVERALATLSYFDVAILGRRASAPALFSVGLMDLICPPSTVYAAFNAYGGPKEIREYPFNDHEGGGASTTWPSCAGCATASGRERGADLSCPQPAPAPVCSVRRSRVGPPPHASPDASRLVPEEPPLPDPFRDLALAFGLDDVGKT